MTWRVTKYLKSFVSVIFLLLSECAGQNMFDVAALKSSERLRAECLLDDWDYGWDAAAQRCVLLTPVQAVESHRRGLEAYNARIRAEQGQLDYLEAQHPAAMACVRRNAGRVSQDYSGQLMTLCLRLTE